jgi:undecaprenyl-phosphate 4-deoxy-4-formamido-L-arabinose transferase
MIDDASREKSWSIIQSLKSSFPNLSAVRLGKNVGQHKAIQCGFRYSSGKAVITIDDDLQTPPEEISKLVREFEENDPDVVYGVQKERKHHWARQAGSRVIERIFKKYAGTPGRGSSFKLIRMSIVEELKYLNYRYAYIDEWISWFTNRYSFVETIHKESSASRYTSWKLIKMAYRIIFSYTTLPLKIITWTGSFTAIGSILLGGFFIYKKYTVGAEIGFTSLIVAITLSTGLIMASLGVIGEFISRIFATQNKRGYFDIEEVLE